MADLDAFSPNRPKQTPQGGAMRMLPFVQPTQASGPMPNDRPHERGTNR